MTGREEVTSTYCQAASGVQHPASLDASPADQEELLPALGATALPVLLPAEGDAG